MVDFKALTEEGGLKAYLEAQEGGAYNKFTKIFDKSDPSTPAAVYEHSEAPAAEPEVKFAVSDKNAEAYKVVTGDKKAKALEGYKPHPQLETHGNAIVNEFHGHARAIEEAEHGLPHQISALQTELAEQVKAGKIDDKLSKEIEASIKQQGLELQKEVSNTKGVLTNHINEIKTDTGSKLNQKAFNPPKVEGSVVGKMATHTYDTQKFHQKVMTDVKANWNKGKMGKLQTTVGAIGVGHGLLNVGRGLKGMVSGNDPENPNKAGAGTLIIGLAEIGGFGLLARAGGRQAATGISK